MGTKVSDEFGAACWTHHDEIPRTGDEQPDLRAQRALDPLKVAAELWATTRGQTEPKSISDDVQGATGASANGTASLESDPTAS